MSILFHHLKVSACPTCGCNTVVKEELEVSSYQRPPQIREHCCGQRWESRTFLCGCCVGWSPNFNRPEVLAPCPSLPGLAALEAEQEALRRAEAKLRDKQSALYKRRDTLVRDTLVHALSAGIKSTGEPKKK